MTPLEGAQSTFFLNRWTALRFYQPARIKFTGLATFEPAISGLQQTLTPTL